MRRFGPALALLAVTAVWGWTFVVVRDAVMVYPVIPFLALRFGLATTLLSPVLLRRTTGMRAGLLPGCMLAASYLLQTEGLRFTTASKAGLLTGLFVVFTPIMVAVTTKIAPRPWTIVAVVGAFCGVVLLAGHGSATVGQNEAAGVILEILTAATLSIHIILLGRVPPAVDPAKVACTQMVVAAIAFAMIAVATGGFPVPRASVVGAVIITGVFASALAFWIQTFVQQRISASRTAVILVAEPAFATFFGVALARDKLTVLQGAGALLILGVLFFHELAPSFYSRVSNRTAPG